MTPPTDITSPDPAVRSLGKRQAQSGGEQERSASPNLKKGRKLANNMKRTPQPTLTQSKLTSMLQATVPAVSAAVDPGPIPAATVELVQSGGRTLMTTEQVEMDTSASAPGPARAAPAITEDFLLRSLKLNTDHIIKSFTNHVNMLSQRVDSNAALIADNSALIAKQADTAAGQGAELAALSSRVADLERGGVQRGNRSHKRAILTDDYLFARRSLRLWPVVGTSKEAAWGGVGDFINGTLGVSGEDIGQEDIESVKRILDQPTSAPDDEVLVTFFDSKKRDLVMSHSVNLAPMVDQEGKPTAGVRLEIPVELTDTFTLLSRFGTRLRARHGKGTKRHIKFDDFSASLFANIKLPVMNPGPESPLTWRERTLTPP